MAGAGRPAGAVIIVAMAEQKRTKAERRQAAATGQTKAARKQARAGKRGQAEPAGPDAGVETRLARIEEAVAAQSELSEQLLGKLDEVLHEARKSARHAKTAVTRSDEDDAAGETEVAESATGA
jgi:hypothetical protein